MESKIAAKITTATITNTSSSTYERKKRMSELSFHTLRKSLTELMHYDYNINNNNKACSNPTTNTTDNNNNISINDRYKISDVPRRTLSIAQNINDMTEHLSKRHTGCDVPNSRTVPLFWSLGNSIKDDTNGDEEEEVDDEDEEEEEVDEENKMIHNLTHSYSMLTIPTAIPKMGSFIHETNYEQQQQSKNNDKATMKKKKNDTPITQIIPADRKRTVVSTIETLFGEAPTLSFDNMLSTTAVKKHGLNHLRKSAPTTATSTSNFSSMVLPPTLKRSATRTSFKSTTTTISSNSSSSSTVTIVSTNPSTISSSSSKQQQTKKDLNYTQLSYWFAPPPPLPSSVTTINDSSKRSHVIQELLSTEKNYQTDMELIKEIYYEFAFDILSKTEIKQIFINLLDIIAFEKEFVIALETACHGDLSEANSPRERTTIGGVFNQMMTRMDRIYGDYCKKHEDAVCKIQDLSSNPNVQEYFEKCKSNIQGRTMCWDLPSLLIKPVQRILKYPLLLRELLLLTSENHPDHEQLVYATIEIQKVADHINEIKKRKDLVEQLMNEKKKADRNVVQGINKRFTRRVHRKKQFSTTQDAIFDDLYKQFEAKQEMARQFERDIQDWLLETKNNVHALSDLIQCLESTYGDSDGIGLRSIHAFKTLVSQLQSNFMDVLVQKVSKFRVSKYLVLFHCPLNFFKVTTVNLQTY
ncbi:Dbl homology domain-containing protein [Backusella circina FSU 941]|nr:Dbl homology domain-containing protein [Backusella circina FSU 941]